MIVAFYISGQFVSAFIVSIPCFLSRLSESAPRGKTTKHSGKCNSLLSSPTSRTAVNLRLASSTMSRESRWDSRTTANDARERGSQLRGRISGTPPNPARSTSSGSNPRLPQAASVRQSSK